MQKVKNFILDSFKVFKSPLTLAFLGMMGALAIVLKAATIDLGPYMKIGFSGLPNRMIDAVFGPIVGAIFAGAMDVVKFFIKPTGPFFFGFTFDAMLASVIYGCILYKKPVSIWRLLIAGFLVKLIVNCGFNTLWMCVLYGKSFFALIPPRLLKNAIMLPVDAGIQFVVLNFVKKLLVRFGFENAK